MISKRQTKLITSLNKKKYRDVHNLFVAERPKVIRELIAEGLELMELFTTNPSDWDFANPVLISASDLKKISALKTPDNALAVFKKPAISSVSDSGLTLALDSLRDPGNLGALIRLCDWFGVTDIVCSKDTADCFNPKVIQASMGSIARVQIHYMDLAEFLQKSKRPIYGGFMDGASVYQTNLPKDGILVLGNEANGISTEIEKLITERISIPRFGETKRTESLNVATAGAIFLNEFRRNHNSE